MILRYSYSNVLNIRTLTILLSLCYTEDDSSSADDNLNVAPSSAFLGQLRLLLAFVAIWQFAFNYQFVALFK